MADFLQDEEGEARPQMHPATVLIREILVLNEVMEYIMRRQMDLNDTDFQALQNLMTNHTMSPGELAQSLHLTAAATTTVIDRLVRKGHVRRDPHPTDRRRWLVSPSEESIRKTMAKLMPMILEVDTKVRNYDDAGQDAIVDFLESIVAYMNERAQTLEREDAAPEPPQQGETTSRPEESGGDHAWSP